MPACLVTSPLQADLAKNVGVWHHVLDHPTLGGGDGVLVLDVLQLHCQQILVVILHSYCLTSLDMPPAFIECVKFEILKLTLFGVEFCLKCFDVGGGGGKM